MGSDGGMFFDKELQSDLTNPVYIHQIPSTKVIGGALHHQQ
jgi:hypothetical protein